MITFRKKQIQCQKSHACCEDKRPCRRCTSLGIEDQCIDSERKKRGRKKKTEADNANTPTATSPDFIVDAKPSKTTKSRKKRNSTAHIEDIEEETDNHTKKVKYATATNHNNFTREESPSLSTPIQNISESPFNTRDGYTQEYQDSIPSFEPFNAVVQQQINQYQERQREEIMRQQIPVRQSTTPPLIHTPQSNGESEFVTNLLQELLTMKQRMEAHNEEIKRLKDQNRTLLEQLQMETHKHTSETRQSFNDLAFSYAYENAGMAMALITVNPPGQILSSNRAFSSLVSSLGLSNVKFAQDLLFNQPEIQTQTAQWFDCLNSKPHYTDNPTDLSYITVVRIATNNGGFHELFYHCSIICDNMGKPLYSLASVFLPHQSRQFQEYAMRTRNVYQAPPPPPMNGPPEPPPYYHNPPSNPNPAPYPPNPLHQISANALRRAPIPPTQPRIDYYPNQMSNYRQ
jgi:hypothetical protein